MSGGAGGQWPAPPALSLVALAGGWRLDARPRPALALTNRDSILIGSFANSTGDPEFDETLTMALKVQLGQSPFLDIVPDDRIGEELRADAAAGATSGSPTTPRAQVCERLGV